MKQAIRQLVEDYALAVDRQDLDHASSLFTPEATLTLPDVPTDLSPCIEHRGQAAIRSALDSVTNCLHTLHAVVGHAAEVHDHTASGSTACIAHHVIDGRSGPEDWAWTVNYDDKFALDEGIWRFTARQLRVDWIEVRPVRLVR